MDVRYLPQAVLINLESEKSIDESFLLNFFTESLPVFQSLNNPQSFSSKKCQ
ncbi:MAG: hypothetical protein HQ569_07490 [Actinobacteria bacterium]|nr:hypothetical protein [Actinomycetota bacterium]